MIEVLFTALYTDGNMLYFNEEFDSFVVVFLVQILMTLILIILIMRKMILQTFDLAN